MTTKARALRALIEAGDYFIAAEAYSALTGRIVEKAGFKAAYVGGHAASAFHYALPDYGNYSQVEQIEQAARISDAIGIPLIADADTLGETVADAYHYARRYAQAGIAGIHVEDEVSPRHSSLSNGLVSIADMQGRIEAAVKGRGDSDLVIIARCDEMYPDRMRGGGSGSAEEAVRRGHAYVEAGADVLFYPITPPDVLEEIIKQVPAPVCTMGATVPGLICTLSTGWGWMGAAQLHQQRCTELMETGKVVFDHQLPDKEALLEMDLYDGVISDWANKTGRKTRA